MNKEQDWQEWIKNLPTGVKGSVALITAIISFVVLLQSNIHLGITVSVVVVLVAVLCLCTYLAFAKTRPLVQGGQGVYRFERYRHLALAGITLIPIIVAMLLAIKPTRSFVIIAFVGTPTPTPTNTPTSTMAPTPSLTPSPTYTPIPTPGLVEIATLNIETEVQADGTQKYSAQLSIEPLEYGDLRLEAPAEMRIRESAFVQLEIIPDSALSDLPRVDVALLSVNVDLGLDSDQGLVSAPDYVLKFDDRIQVYPVMSAELEGVNFEISPSGPQVMAVASALPVKWIWTITPKAIGAQSFVLTISIPVVIDQDTDQVASYPLKSIPLQMFVEPFPEPSPTPTPTPTADGPPLSILPLIVAIGLVFSAIFVVLFGAFWFSVVRRLHPMSGEITIYRTDEYRKRLTLQLPAVNFRIFSCRNVDGLKSLGIKRLSIKCPNMEASKLGVVKIKLELLSGLPPVERILHPGSTFHIHNLRFVKDENSTERRL